MCQFQFFSQRNHGKHCREGNMWSFRGRGSRCAHIHFRLKHGPLQGTAWLQTSRHKRYTHFDRETVVSIAFSAKVTGYVRIRTNGHNRGNERDLCASTSGTIRRTQGVDNFCCRLCNLCGTMLFWFIDIVCQVALHGSCISRLGTWLPFFSFSSTNHDCQP